MIFFGKINHQSVWCKSLLLNLPFLSCKGFLLRKGAKKIPDNHPGSWIRPLPKFLLHCWLESATFWREWTKWLNFGRGKRLLQLSEENHETSRICLFLCLLVTGVIEQLRRIGKPITLSMKNAGGWLIFWHDHHLWLRLLEAPDKDTPRVQESLPKKAPSSTFKE